MKIAFLTEMGFHGRIPADHPNMRTEFAWMYALDADHYNVMEFQQVTNYDCVMLILPKGGVSLNSEGQRLNDNPNRFAQLYAQPFVETLKKYNKKVAYVQEGPTWYVNDFSLTDQFNFYNQLSECDVIFAHNSYDTLWYRGWFPGKMVTIMPTLMIHTLIENIVSQPENKIMIGGNFCRWYGGFQSYLTATEFNCPIYVQTSHCSQPGEDQVPGLNVLPRLIWIDWIKTLSTFKVGINLMPTVAAGTFSLNCAYLGIPCIGNKNVDTQNTCFPDLSVSAEDVAGARYLAGLLRDDPDFYTKCASKAKNMYKQYYNIDIWKKHVYSILEN